MSPSESIAALKALHLAYCARTGFDLTLDMSRENVWRAWMTYRSPPFTEDDLATVIAYLRSEIKRGNRNDGALKFRNLIGSPDFFEEDLALARKWRSQWAGQRRPAAPRAATAEPPPPDDPRTPEERARDWRARFQ